jgi:hypothetical protein
MTINATYDNLTRTTYTRSRTRTFCFISYDIALVGTVFICSLRADLPAHMSVLHGKASNSKPPASAAAQALENFLHDRISTLLLQAALMLHSDAEDAPSHPPFQVGQQIWCNGDAIVDDEIDHVFFYVGRNAAVLNVLPLHLLAGLRLDSERISLHAR